MRELKYTAAIKTAAIVNLVLGALTALIIFFTAGMIADVMINYVEYEPGTDPRAVELAAQMVSGMLIFYGVILIGLGLAIFLVSRKSNSGVGSNVAVLVLAAVGGMGIVNIFLIVYAILNIVDANKRQSESEYQEPPRHYE